MRKRLLILKDHYQFSAYALHFRRINLKFSNFAAAQLEAALGTFYAPVKPLSEVTVLEYRDPISRLARRFFHHLLRFTRFDKAFLLAVDIGARDLFMVRIFLLIFLMVSLRIVIRNNLMKVRGEINVIFRTFTM